MKFERSAVRSFAGAPLVFRNADGRACSPRKWFNESSYGGGGRRATRKLKWAPPAMDNPITIKVTDAQTNVTIPAGQDAYVLLPGAVGNDLQTKPHQPKREQNNGLTISGGRNVIVMGGAVRRDVDMMAGKYVTSSSLYRAARNRAFFLKDWTGTFFMEGVYIGGQFLYEAFNISSKSPTAKLIVQNICVDAVCLKSPDWTGESSHDGGDAGLQNWDGPAAGMWVDGFSTKATTYQFMFMQPTQFTAGLAPELTEFNNVNVDWARPEITGWPVEGRKLPWPWDNSTFGKGNKMMHFDSTGTVANAGTLAFNSFWMNHWPEFGGGGPKWSVNPDPSDAVACRPSLNADETVLTYPGLSNVSGQINIGIPPVPGGQFVPRETVGIGYVSPGYVGVAAALDPPTDAPTLALAGETHNSQSLTLTSVAKATRYGVQFKRSADSTWTDGPSTSSLSVTVTGLDPDTTYNFRAQASNTDGSGPWSNTVSNTTDTAPVVNTGGENSSGPWEQVYFYDGTSAFTLTNPQNMFYVDTVQERIETNASGTAGTYYAMAPNSTAGPSQLVSAKLSGLTTTTTRRSLYLVANVKSASDAAPAEFYALLLQWTSATGAATFTLYKSVGGTVSTLATGTGTFAEAIDQIMQLEHTVVGGVHYLRAVFDNVEVIPPTADASPLLGVYGGLRHYNAGGGSSTTYAQASIDDLRISGKPALAA